MKILRDFQLGKCANIVGGSSESTASPANTLTYSWKNANITFHKLEKVEGTPATCVASGTEDSWKCNGSCGKLFADTNGYNEIEATTSISPLGLTKVEATTATCTAEGNEAYWKCENEGCCGKMFEDASANKEVTDVTVKATGHKWDAGKITTEATTEKEGVRTYTCQNAGCPVKTKTEAVPKLTKASTTPDTGDYATPVLWIALMLLCVASASAVMFMKKRSR